MGSLYTMKRVHALMDNGGPINNTSVTLASNFPISIHSQNAAQKQSLRYSSRQAYVILLCTKFSRCVRTHGDSSFRRLAEAEPIFPLCHPVQCTKLRKIRITGLLMSVCQHKEKQRKSAVVIPNTPICKSSEF